MNRITKSIIVAFLAIILVLTVFSYQHFTRAFEFGDSTIDINLPVWPSKLLVTFALAVLFFRLLLQFFGFLRLILYPDAVPAGVPLIADVVEQATQEVAVSDSGEKPLK